MSRVMSFPEVEVGGGGLGDLLGLTPGRSNASPPSTSIPDGLEARQPDEDEGA
jgi:hypothetical protein